MSSGCSLPQINPGVQGGSQGDSHSQVKFGKRTSSNPETPISNSSTPPSLQPTMCESDSSSMNSLELERPVAPEDSDTGMESMSSADAPLLSSNIQSIEDIQVLDSVTDADLEISS
ncbi:rap1 GTPase-activating protein 1 [Trichonephila clavipes]|nr:rap1 GTPase-activating protein 1 [Trichonephila clavipes]